MEESLDAAVNHMIRVAVLDGSHGILVIRREKAHFTIELSEAVPFGYTQQLDLSP